MTVKLFYKDVDISDSVDVLRCVHEMHAEGAADSIKLTVDDSKNLWDKWEPQKGDAISITAEGVKTGKMFLVDTYQEAARFTLHASALPPGAKKPRDKAWQKVRHFQIMEEIAENHGLGLKRYGIDDVIIEYNLQKGEHDFSFLNRLCILEGCSFLIYDGNLVVYSERAIEAEDPVGTIDLSEVSSFGLVDHSENLCGSCIVERGEYRGIFQSTNGKDAVYVPGTDIRLSISSDAEAGRFAKNLLRFHNKKAFTGHIRTGEVVSYIPGSVYQLKSTNIASWSGPVLITRVRNDYIKNESKVFFRRTLGGEY